MTQRTNITSNTEVLHVLLCIGEMAQSRIDVNDEDLSLATQRGEEEIQLGRGKIDQLKSEIQILTLQL